MKQFIITLMSFTLVILLLATALDYIITKGLHHYSMYETEVWNDLRNPNISPDVIILGSCQALYDYNPMVLDSVLHCNSYVYAMSNLTFPCHNFMWETYKYYNEDNMPSLVILTLDYGDLTNKRIKGTEDCRQFLPLINEKGARKFLINFGGYSWFEVNLPCYRYYGNQMMIKHGLISYFTKKGGTRQHEKGHIGLHSEYNAHSEWFTRPTSVSIDSSVVKMLDDFVGDINNKDIKLIITIAPLSEECEKSITNLDDVYAQYYSVAQKHNITLLDYSSHRMAQNIENMESPFHLNNFAADEYSAMVANAIDSLQIYRHETFSRD